MIKYFLSVNVKLEVKIPIKSICNIGKSGTFWGRGGEGRGGALNSYARHSLLIEIKNLTTTELDFHSIIKHRHEIMVLVMVCNECVAFQRAVSVTDLCFG